MRIKTENGKCSVNCEGFSAAVGCLQGWTVGKDCPGDMEVLAHDGPIIFEVEEQPTPTCTIINNNEHFIDIPKKRGKKVLDKDK